MLPLLKVNIIKIVGKYKSRLNILKFIYNIIIGRYIFLYKINLKKLET